MTPRPYRLLARYYDPLQHGTAERNRHARSKTIGPILRRARSIVDLGCGTGTTAVELARGGRDVTAIDFSPEMCRQARAKAKRARARVRVRRGDARTFRLRKPVDVVISEFNPLNHLPKKSDLAVAFRAVARALKPGGHFFFDVNMPRAHAVQFPGTHWMEGPGFKLVLQARNNERREKAEIDCHWFLRNGAAWRYATERVEEVSWSDAEIRRALRSAGFEAIRHWDGMDVRTFVRGAERGFDAYYLARKRAAR